jgi:hypothetical protein
MAPGASGGPGSSSAPGSRIQNAHPVAGVATTDADIGKPQRAAVPAWIRPAKWVQCQQGRTSWRCGLKWLVEACMREASAGGWLMERACPPCQTTPGAVRSARPG